MSTKPEKLQILLDNYSKAVIEVRSALIYDRQGQLLAKRLRGRLINFLDAKGSAEHTEMYRGLANLVTQTLLRITSDYSIGAFGTGTFETDDHRLVFTESGPDAILLTVFDYDSVLNNVLPYSFLVAEKIANILGDRYTETVNLSVPNLELGYELGIQSTDQMRKPVTYGEHDVPKEVEMRFKLIILGNEKTGKTSLINQFVTKKFYNDYRPTLGISITSQIYAMQGFEEEGVKINLMIWDLAGQKFFKRVRKHYYQQAHAAFIVYDTTHRPTFKDVPKWYLDIRATLPDIPLVILGNKVDLEEERVVSTEEGKILAKELHCGFMETSAKTGINVRDAFGIIGIGLFFKLDR